MRTIISIAGIGLGFWLEPTRAAMDEDSKVTP
jgi:hypothetical protein